MKTIGLYTKCKYPQTVIRLLYPKTAVLKNCSRWNWYLSELSDGYQSVYEIFEHKLQTFEDNEHFRLKIFRNVGNRSLMRSEHNNDERYIFRLWDISKVDGCIYIL